MRQPTAGSASFTTARYAAFETQPLFRKTPGVDQRIGRGNPNMSVHKRIIVAITPALPLLMSAGAHAQQPQPQRPNIVII